MGKTNPTYRDKVSSLEESWSGLRRGLRFEDQSAFDEIWEHARNYADAAGYKNPDTPMEGVLLSICLGQQRRLGELEERLVELEIQGGAEIAFECGFCTWRGDKTDLDRDPDGQPRLCPQCGSHPEPDAL